MMDLRGVKQTWENLAQTDPLWAICTDDKKRGGKWDAAEFFATGEGEIRKMLAHVAAIGLNPQWEGRALDFGCGVGRLTQALCKRFTSCAGVDISSTMISLAEQYNSHGERCVYAVNDADLSKYANDEFAFIYSSIVLQHIAPKYMKSYLREFARVLAPGGILVCQIPDYEHSFKWLVQLRRRLSLGTHLRSIIRGKLLEPAEETNSQGMEMHWLDEAQVRQALKSRRCRVVDVQLTNSTSPDFNGELIYLQRAAGPRFVSKQYCVVK